MALHCSASPSLQQNPLFDPAFTSDSVPSGYTETDASGGAIAYSPGQVVTSDFSVPGSEAYISATSTSNTGASFTTNLTFTPSYTADANAGGTDAGTTVLDLYPQTGSNRPILELGFTVNQFYHKATVGVGGDIAYGNTSTYTGANEFAPPGINSLDGVPITIHLTTTLTNLGPDAAEPGIFSG